MSILTCIVLILIFLLVLVFQILSKTLTLVFLMQTFVLFSVQIWRQGCQHFYLPFCCQLSVFYLDSLCSSQELHKFSFCSDAYPKSILLSPPKVIKCFIKMQEPCKDWKWVGQDKVLNSPSHARAAYFQFHKPNLFYLSVDLIWLPGHWFFFPE